MVIYEVNTRVSWVKGLWDFSVQWVLLIQGSHLHRLKSESMDVEPMAIKGSQYIQNPHEYSRYTVD